MKTLKIAGLFFALAIGLLLLITIGILLLSWIAEYSESLAFMIFNFGLLAMSCYALVSVAKTI